MSCLCYHDEALAITFGFVMTPQVLHFVVLKLTNTYQLLEFHNIFIAMTIDTTIIEWDENSK
jgi:hypothetical protein